MSTATAETTALILSGSGYALEVSPDAIKQKADLIQAAAAITVVTTNEQADEARSEVKKLAAMRNLVEKSRKAVKEPVLKIGKDIDAKAAEFVAEVTAEEGRLTKLIGNHAAEVERQRQEAIRKQQEEERKRLLAEAEAKRKEEEAERARLAAEAEAEKARKAAEAAMWADDDDAEAAKAKEEAERVAAAAEAERVRVAAEAADQKRIADEAAAAAQTSGLVVNTAATSGVKFDLDYEVEDIAALHAKHPQLVELSPRRSEILSMLKMLAPSSPDGLPTLAGLKVIKKPRVSTR